MPVSEITAAMMKNRTIPILNEDWQLVTRGKMTVVPTEGSNVASYIMSFSEPIKQVTTPLSASPNDHEVVDQRGNSRAKR
jgi:hypothetical protein